MPAFAAITINDGADTPVSHTFDPISAENGVYVWAHKGSGVAALGYKTITYWKKTPGGAIRAGLASGADRVWRQHFNLAVPVLETLATNDSGLTPPPTIAHVYRYNAEMVQPERGTLTERKHVRGLFANLFDHATVLALLNDQAGLTGA